MLTVTTALLSRRQCNSNIISLASLSLSLSQLQGQLREAEELKQQGNALFARKECEEACERWVDAIGALPAVDSAGDATDATDPASDPPPPQQQLAELTDEEAQAMQAEMDDPHLGALKELQRREQELRATLWSNVAEGRLRLVRRVSETGRCELITDILHSTRRSRNGLRQRKQPTMVSR